MANDPNSNARDSDRPTGAAREALRMRLDRERLLRGARMELFRQQQEVFEQRKLEDIRWNRTRRQLCYMSMLGWLAILAMSSYILLCSSKFSATIQGLAGGALLGDAFTLIGVVWKIVLNPEYRTQLSPTVDMKQILSAVTDLPNNDEGKTSGVPPAR